MVDCVKRQIALYDFIESGRGGDIRHDAEVEVGRSCGGVNIVADLVSIGLGADDASHKVVFCNELKEDVADEEAIAAS